MNLTRPFYGWYVPAYYNAAHFAIMLARYRFESIRDVPAGSYSPFPRHSACGIECVECYVRLDNGLYTRRDGAPEKS